MNEYVGTNKTKKRERMRLQVRSLWVLVLLLVDVEMRSGGLIGKGPYVACLAFCRRTHI